MVAYSGDDEILKLFYEESREHLDGIEDNLLALEKQGANIDADLVNGIFRSVHTIKGGCGFFGLEKLSTLSHTMENLLDRIRKKELVPNSAIINVLLKGADLLKILINDPEKTDSTDTKPVIDSIKKILSGSMSKEEKKSTNQEVLIKFPDGRAVFTVSRYDFDRAKKADKGGNQIYLIHYDLIKDIERKGKTPWDVIHELMQLAVFIDSKVDVDGMGDLSAEGPVTNSIPFYVLISTVIETDLIYDFLGLDRSRISLIDDNGNIVPVTEVGSVQQLEPQPVSAPEPEPVHEQPVPVKAAEAPRQEYIPQPAEPVSYSLPPAAATPAPTSSAPASAADSSDKGGKKQTAESSSVRVNVTLLDRLMSLAGELVLARNQLLQSSGTRNFETIENAAQKVDLITAELQEAIMATRMQTVGIVLNKFNRIVRDMSRDLGKEVRLLIEGEDVELDKSIIESIGDPLTHLVRNSMDHGIERPEIRAAAGKPAMGTLKIAAFHEAGHVNIKISDDGNGINIDRVKAKAIQTGLCTAEQLQQMGEKEIMRLIFKPGFSTAEKVTDISGRGVGMDVVHTNLSKLGGTVDLESVMGKGTTVTIKLPLTLAIIPSLLLSVGAEKMAIPQVNLVELVRISIKDASRKIEKVGKAIVMRLRDKLLPLVKLEHVIAKDPVAAAKNVLSGAADKVINIAVVNAGEVHYGIIVDNLLDSSEIVVKPLGQHLKNCKIYAGATILGDGRVALILDVVGIARFMELSVMGDEGSVEEESSKEAIKGETDERDRQSLLIVHNGNREPFGIPLGLVARIEKIKRTDVEMTGGRRAIKYRGGMLPMFALEEVANVSMRDETDTLVVVVFKVAGREVGLMLSEIIDVVESDAKIDDVTYKQPGIYGSAVINNRITLLIDLYGIVYTVMPHWMQEHKEEVEVKKAGKVKSGKPTALVAEDSKFFLSQIKSFLEDSGYDVVTAVDGLDACNVLAANQEKVDIVLTDIEMPNMDGFEFAAKVRQNPAFAELPVIAVTSIAGAAAEQRAKEVGIDEYLIKLDRDDILKKCSEYLQNGRKHA